VPYSADAFAGFAVIDILSDSALLKSFSEHAIECAKQYDWNSCSLDLLK